MDSDQLQRWMQSRQQGEFGALQDHANILYPYLTESKSAKRTAEELVDDVSSLPLDPDSDRAWRVWQLLFGLATESAQHHDQLVELTKCVQAQPPRNSSEGSDNRLLLDVWMDWRDEYDGLETHRHLRQKYEFEPLFRMSGRQKYLNFTMFSAKLMARGGPEFRDNIGAFAFFETRNVLESTPEKYVQEVFKDETTEFQEARSAGIEAAAQWIIYGGIAIRNMTHASFEGFEIEMAKSTDFWSGEAGMSDERWRLWIERMKACVENEDLDEAAETAAKQAIQVGDVEAE